MSLIPPLYLSPLIDVFTYPELSFQDAITNSLYIDAETPDEVFFNSSVVQHTETYPAANIPGGFIQKTEINVDAFFHHSIHRVPIYQATSPFELVSWIEKPQDLETQIAWDTTCVDSAGNLINNSELKQSTFLHNLESISQCTYRQIQFGDTSVQSRIVHRRKILATNDSPRNLKHIRLLAQRCLNKPNKGTIGRETEEQTDEDYAQFFLGCKAYQLTLDRPLNPRETIVADLNTTFVFHSRASAFGRDVFEKIDTSVAFSSEVIANGG